MCYCIGSAIFRGIQLQQKHLKSIENRVGFKTQADSVSPCVLGADRKDLRAVFRNA